MFDLASRSATLPCPVTIIGVEPLNCSPGEGLTEPVSAAINQAVDAVVRALGNGS
jgi:Ni,Fe-hydrogenase maturation factor